MFEQSENDLLKQSLAGLIRQHTELCWEVWLSNIAPDGIKQVQWDMLVVSQIPWAINVWAELVIEDQNLPSEFAAAIKKHKAVS